MLVGRHVFIQRLSLQSVSGREVHVGRRKKSRSPVPNGTFTCVEHVLEGQRLLPQPSATNEPGDHIVILCYSELQLLLETGRESLV